VNNNLCTVYIYNVNKYTEKRLSTSLST